MEVVAIAGQQTPGLCLESDQPQARHSVASSSQVDMTITTLKQASLATTWGPTNVERLCILCGGNSPDSLPFPPQDPTKYEVNG